MDIQDVELTNLLKTVDWKNIPKKHITQISHEVKIWRDDYLTLQKYQKRFGVDVEEPFNIKFQKWINKRINMVLNK